MKNHEKPKFNNYIKELQSQKEFISRRKLIEFWRKDRLLGAIWYRDGNTEIQSIRGMAKGNSNNKRKRFRSRNAPNMAPREKRYDENHEFDVIRIAELRERFQQKRENEDRRNPPDGDRQLPSKKRSKIRKTYSQTSEYKADELLLAS